MRNTSQVFTSRVRTHLASLKVADVCNNYVMYIVAM